jgi:DNA gyrase inhibitor GyrI
MSELPVRIEKLEAMQVASVRAVGETPELDAWEKLNAWAEPRGLLKDPEEHSIFGFNNPSPSPDRKEYGYELWIRVGADVEPQDEIELKEFPGGTYAVTTHQGFPNPEAWMKLWQWVQSSQFTWRKTHELEKVVNPFGREEDIVCDLYLPIEDK